MGLSVFEAENLYQIKRKISDGGKGGGGRNTNKHAATVVETVRARCA